MNWDAIREGLMRLAPEVGLTALVLLSRALVTDLVALGQNASLADVILRPAEGGA